MTNEQEINEQIIIRDDLISLGCSYSCAVDFAIGLHKMGYRKQTPVSEAKPFNYEEWEKSINCKAPSTAQEAMETGSYIKDLADYLARENRYNVEYETYLEIAKLVLDGGYVKDCKCEHGVSKLDKCFLCTQEEQFSKPTPTQQNEGKEELSEEALTKFILDYQDPEGWERRPLHVQCTKQLSHAICQRFTSPKMVALDVRKVEAFFNEFGIKDQLYTNYGLAGRLCERFGSAGLSLTVEGIKRIIIEVSGLSLPPELRESIAEAIHKAQKGTK